MKGADVGIECSPYKVLSLLSILILPITSPFTKVPNTKSRSYDLHNVVHTSSCQPELDSPLCTDLEKKSEGRAVFIFLLLFT
jgi:hypothetical protein